MVTSAHSGEPLGHYSPFVNRQEELARLLSLVPPQKQTASFVILTAPSGYGKTRLTTRLLELLREEGVQVLAVEPQVRAKAFAQSVYQGFFIQRCAEALDGMSLASGSPLLRFEDFLRSDRLRRARATDWRGALRKVPSIKSAYEFGLELIDRVFNTGDHSARRLLTNDSREAVDTCARYVRQLEGVAQLVMVVREAQHIDSTSLRLLSEIFHPGAACAIILEYTQDARRTLNPLFEDFIEAAPLHDVDWMRIIELVQLTKPHLEELLRLTIPGSGIISGEYYLHWDGNVRAIRQLRFSVSMEHRLELPQLSDVKAGVIQEYQRQIALQSSTARMVLCLLYSHGEAMPASLLPLLLERLNALITKMAFEVDIDALLEAELVIRHEGDAFGIDNEDVAEAVRTLPTLAGGLLLAKGCLRDHYRRVVLAADDIAHNVSLALRQALRLSVELGDVTTIEAMVDQLSKTVTTNMDQSWYVTQIVAAVNGNAHLFADQRNRLVAWAAELAFEVADFQKARDLLRQLSTQSVFSDALLCACLVETGDHAEAAHTADILKMSVDPDECFAGELIELILLRCTGRIEEARELWDRLEQRPGTHDRRLYGYLLRFKELVVDFPLCIDALRASVEWFAKRGLASSAAYSELTLASHIARTGDTEGAAESIAAARSLLTLTARDQHIVLNNDAAVNLLSDEPSPPQCCEWLIRAVPCAGDDYSALVLYTNLSIAAALAGRHELAGEAVERALRIAEKPKFAERNVFWGVIFNLRYVDNLLALDHRIQLDSLTAALQPHVLQNEYWEYRFRHAEAVPERFATMLAKPYHPMFLSHWTLDIDGLRTLKPEYVQEVPDKTIRDA